MKTASAGQFEAALEEGTSNFRSENVREENAPKNVTKWCEGPPYVTNVMTPSLCDKNHTSAWKMVNDDNVSEI